MISPILFSLYVSDCAVSEPSCSFIKYADDIVITGLVKNNDVNAYLSQIEQFVHWCDIHHLCLNVNKTKEMIFDFRRINESVTCEPLIIHNHRSFQKDET